MVPDVPGFSRELPRKQTPTGAASLEVVHPSEAPRGARLTKVESFAADLAQISQQSLHFIVEDMKVCEKCNCTTAPEYSFVSFFWSHCFSV